MQVELEFLDLSITRIHNDEIIVTDGIPVPSTGELVHFEGVPYKVLRREFVYLSAGGRHLKITFLCEEIK